MADERFPKSSRLLRPAQFDRVYRRRKSVADGILIVYGCENGLDHPRLGLTVSRKIGGAVKRNRWKRVIRDAFRRLCAELPPGIDLVVTPRRDATPTAESARTSLESLAKRLVKKLQLDAKQEAPEGAQG